MVLSPGELWAALIGRSCGTAGTILLHIRLPRTCACLLAGAALAVSGAIIQSVLANPLAAPNIIGVNAGAGLMVALACALAPTALALTPVLAFLGAMAGVLLVLAIARRTGASRLTVALAGVAVSSVFNAGIDAGGHLCPGYAEQLRRLSGGQSGQSDPGPHPPGGGADPDRPAFSPDAGRRDGRTAAGGGRGPLSRPERRAQPDGPAGGGRRPWPGRR